MPRNGQAAKIGILCWQIGHVPNGLQQLETLVGNSTNPGSYDFRVRFNPVRGANVHTILKNAGREVLRAMIGDARKLVAEGIPAITTSCGFNAVSSRNWRPRWTPRCSQLHDGASARALARRRASGW